MSWAPARFVFFPGLRIALEFERDDIYPFMPWKVRMRKLHGAIGEDTNLGHTDNNCRIPASGNGCYSIEIIKW